MPTRMRCCFHVIWTSYGTWLPGDDREHWSPLFDMYGRLVRGGRQLNLPDATTRSVAESRLVEAPRMLNEDDQSIVATTIGDVLRSQMESTALIYAAAVESTHVHLLLGPLNEAIDRVVGRFKGRASSEVIARGSDPARTRTWTTGFWKVFLWDRDGLATVAEYIEQHNLRRGLPRHPYDWITPT